MADTRYDSLDSDRNTERPVRLDRTEGYVVIEGKPYPARELVEALAQSGYAELRAVGDSLVLGRKRITPIFKSSKDRAMSALCHGSLSYCCPLSKRCAERDRALEILGLTQEDYEQLKGKSHIQFIDASRGHPLHDEYRSRDLTRDTANRPAVDRGFGSDDYRRDFDTLEGVLRGSHESPNRNQRDGRYELSERRPSASEMARREHGKPDSFVDDELDGRYLGRHDNNTERSQPSVCSIKRDESIEGLGALFAQGELSPFIDDAHDSTERPSFCFSCGRTIRKGISRCPFCGASQ